MMRVGAQFTDLPSFLGGVLDLSSKLATHEAEDLAGALDCACEKGMALVGVEGVAFWEFVEGALVLKACAGIARSFATTMMQPVPDWLLAKAGAGPEVFGAEAAGSLSDLCGVHQEFRAVLQVPVRYRSAVLGVLWFIKAADWEVESGASERALIVSDQVAHAVARTRNYQLIRQTLRESEAVRYIATSIMMSRDLQEILRFVTASARRLLRATAAVIGLFAEGGHSLRITCQAGVPGQLDGTTLRMDPAGSFERARREVERELEAMGLVVSRTVMLGLSGRLLGCLTVAWEEARCFSRNDEAVLNSLAAHAAIAIQNARLFDQVMEQRNELRRLARHQFHVEEEQWRRIARELHDEIGQSLTSVLIDSQRMAAQSGDNWAFVIAELQRVIASLREIAYQLRPPMLESAGLVESLRWLAASVSRGGETAVEVGATLARRLPGPVELCLYRITQEALTNTLKHADARHVKVSLEEDDGQIWLSVVDDGRGFDQARARGRGGGGLGLVGMRERACELGGTLTVSSAPGRGTRIDARVPISGASNGNESSPG